MSQAENFAMRHAGGITATTEREELPDAVRTPNLNKTKPWSEGNGVYRKPTMSDVARLAGVASVTVSRVLSGRLRVSSETARRVYTAVEQLKYRPNDLARAFRQNQSRSIGLILPCLYDPFFANCTEAVTSVAREYGYSVLVATTDEDPATEHAQAELMLERHVDGVVMAPSQLHREQFSTARFGETPVVILDRSVSDPSVDIVTAQNTAGARRIVLHLAEEHGHKRIAYVGSSRLQVNARARLLGYRRAMDDLRLRQEVVFDCDNEEAARQMLKQRLGDKEPLTALFISNPLSTGYVLSAVRDMGIEIPDELAIAAFAESEMAELTAPALTLARLPARAMGRQAALLLLERIRDSGRPRSGRRITLPVEIVVRNSCGCQAISHP